MAITLATPQLVVNNVTIAVVPNSVSFTEGFGKQEMRVQSAGGNVVQEIYTEDVSENLSDIKWQMVNTIENIELIRTWKTNRNANAITINSVVEDFTRSFRNVALLNNYEVKLGADTMIELEFKGTAAV